jgi:Lar family restriction alleviation protein
MMSELLPCPFCGGEAEFATDNGKSWAIVCQTCIARVGGRHYPDYAEKKEMISKWNRRVDPKCAYPECGCAIKCNE